MLEIETHVGLWPELLLVDIAGQYNFPMKANTLG